MSDQPQTLTIRRPDDWHVHLRDGEMLAAVAPFTARQFARAIVMPNLTPPITTVAAATAYRDSIRAAAGGGFEPLMTCYLTDDADPAEIVRGFEAGVFTACKLYPAHATTNSAHGVTDVSTIRPVLAAMEGAGMVLCVHGEVTDPAIDVFDREAVFIDRVLTALLREFPALKVVLEHITTADAAQFVADGPATLAATITPQHLHLNRNALFAGGLRPHNYCLPVLKRERHRVAVRAAAVGGSGKFFLGTDSAPHRVGDKERDCGCAGVWNAPFALETYLAVFDEESALDRFAGFASEYGARFYGLPLNKGSVTLIRNGTEVPARIGEVVPFYAGERLAWRMLDD